MIQARCTRFSACSRGIAGLQCRGHDPVEDGSPAACDCLRRRARAGVSHIQFASSRVDFPGDFDPRCFERDSAIRIAARMATGRGVLRTQRALVLQRDAPVRPALGIRSRRSFLVGGGNLFDGSRGVCCRNCVA
jgi:hypothetical protein